MSGNSNQKKGRYEEITNYFKSITKYFSVKEVDRTNLRQELETIEFPNLIPEHLEIDWTENHKIKINPYYSESIFYINFWFPKSHYAILVDPDLSYFKVNSLR